MRNLFIDSYNCGTTGCCGIDELHGFAEALRGSRPKPITDEEWLESLSKVTEYEGNIGSIVLFSGTEEQGKYKFSPQGLAKWLISQGEEVVSTAYVRNSNSGNRIQAFLWSTSSTFRNRLNEYREKQEDNDREDRGVA